MGALSFLRPPDTFVDNGGEAGLVFRPVLMLLPSGLVPDGRIDGRELCISFRPLHARNGLPCRVSSPAIKAALHAAFRGCVALCRFSSEATPPALFGRRDSPLPRSRIGPSIR